jgi:hypothetical protein
MNIVRALQDRGFAMTAPSHEDFWIFYRPGIQIRFQFFPDGTLDTCADIGGRGYREEFSGLEDPDLLPTCIAFLRY